MSATLEFLLSPILANGFEKLADTVRRGGTLLDEGRSLAPENPMWVKFARAMVPMMMMPAQQIAKLVNLDGNRKLKVLDIAAGHGIFGVTIAQQNPNAGIVALDWPHVLEVAKEYAGRAAVSYGYR